MTTLIRGTLLRVVLRVCCIMVAGAGAAGLVGADRPTLGADGEQPFAVRFVGGAEETPLGGLRVEFTNGYGASQKRFGPYTSDKDGVVRARLPLGFYSLHLDADRELPYLAVERLWHGEPRGPLPDLSLNITASGAEKWLRGERREGPRSAAADQPHMAPLTYCLLPACVLVLRAVDADTGQGLAGVEFYEENAVGEDWAHPIDGASIGWRAPRGDDVGRPAPATTDARGMLVRPIKANAGFAYGAMRLPRGYEQVEPKGEVAIEVVFGQTRAERTFTFRRTAGSR